ncbi:bifunctional hydroxymethylpyrimidine kinase/phosphomethylpyrimidine kinase [Massilia yuzhufengensis]|uniref:hydroxymethylpyrimidine kinase n=1 Tax=Massilia yuzhufengensis TaxID=1164594 RepID=A0A1I1KWL2_9BURK|nr:hydroxymethylpyrimidine/phosphomethylpyrimidine kinase [Massilia yuzhufengensis]SFC64692.1 hydroxymethylpyrimidine/phosphomethylpyrimidine kinase [Massilia yuzhufengensis]
MVPTVLVFAGLDPGGGAGMAADIAAIGALGGHALPVATALTVQDNNRVHEVRPVDAAFLVRQADALIDACSIDAVKIGIPGSRENAAAIARLLRQLRAADPALPIVLDPVLASGHGDALGAGSAIAALAELLPLATILVPNLPEARALGAVPCEHVLVTGGHGEGEVIVNRWLRDGVEQRAWRLPRLPHTYHGSGCTLAAAIAARLALGDPMQAALEHAQDYCHQALAHAFWIGPGQRIPRRILHTH